MRSFRNTDIREYAKSRGVFLWEIAERCGYSYPSAFSEVLRHELDDEQKRVIREIIDEIAAEQGVTE